MPDISAIASAVSAFKAAKDIGESMIGLRDAAAFQSKLMEFQSKILDANNAAFAAQEERSTLLERIRELEKQLASFEKWEVEKENYQLTAIYADTLAYARKPDAAGAVPPHYICANCYEDGKKRILQRADAAHVMCPDCKIRLRFDSEEARQFNRPLRPRSDGWT
ncbi:hypothetical protein BKD09_24010 [Bradyrhizobium japonicum]|uniref:Uncharacterized protein n=1 Tax=Bradyrhizobium japonicum TaxID=375 RepID=A0A1L3FDP2_BRAJP|nr:hypothetical protein [Bradyrhizobium japonicum]APG11403.1 hypothetical protein BKD09_24010 [Bradyrhizobium japonicum]